MCLCRRPYKDPYLFEPRGGAQHISGKCMTIVERMATISFAHAFLLLFFIFHHVLLSNTNAATSSPPPPPPLRASKFPGCGKNEQTLRFYSHTISSGVNSTDKRVAGPSKAAKYDFGGVVVGDKPLTIKPDLGSTLIGRVQGMNVSVGQGGLSGLLLVNYFFHPSKVLQQSKESSLSVQGRITDSLEVMEFAVLGGTGLFQSTHGRLFAQKIRDATTSSMMEYNLCYGNNK